MRFHVRALSRIPGRSAQRGMTLIETMIVLAIIALVMGLLVGPVVLEHWRKAKIEIATIAVRKYVDEAYPAWAAAHPDRGCPDKLEELQAFMNSKATTDPWGHRYALTCGSSAPATARGIAISSLGEDGKPATDDDIRSWD